MLVTYLIISTVILNLQVNGLKKKCNNLIVNTPMGKIQGSIPFKTAVHGKDIISFRGIRYAKAPVQNLRFQPPVPIEKYHGIYDATRDGDACPQADKEFEPMSEDCLFLNVYTTRLPEENYNPSKAVIVHIHTGGHKMMTGRSNWAGPQYFMDNDIVLVTFNFRLGTLGMLSTDDELAPGNNCFKDQVLVLKWVQRNIASFGGDPNRVTLMGYSSGARSVYLHMVSPMSKGLFHKAIANSGSPLGLYKMPTSQPELAKKQAELLNCPSDTSRNILQCLKTKSAKEIGDTYNDFYEYANNPNLIWVPVIEKDYGQERFLPDHPINLIQQGKVMKIPLLTGITHDGFLDRSVRIVFNDTLLNELNENWETYAPIIAMYEKNTTKSKFISQKCKEFYFNNNSLPFTNSSLYSLGEFASDGLVGYPSYRIVKLLRKHLDTIYLYQFSYKGKYSYNNYPGTKIPAGVNHQDDQIYVFYISEKFPYFDKVKHKSELEMASKLTSLYANFAILGYPTEPRQARFDYKYWGILTDYGEYCYIDKKLEIRRYLNKERYAFWEKLHPYDKI